MKPIVNLIKLGRAPYVDALKVQRVLFDNLKNSLTTTTTLHNQHAVEIGGERTKPRYLGNGDLIHNPSNCFLNNNKNNNNNIVKNSHQQNQARNSLILVEHDPVYTIGLRSKDYDDNYLVELKKILDEHNLSADFVKTNRGGLITFHGPGQLVAYPIIYLGDFNKTIKNKSVRAYVNTLEMTIIDTLASVGLSGAHTVADYPGVWLDGGERKIAFVGVACKRYVTMHGISINCDCDLSWFDHIVSCGIVDKKITSVRQEILNASMKLRPSDEDTSRVVQNPSLTDMDCLQIEQSIIDSANSHGGRDKSLKTKSSVENIAQAFCTSFSKHFDCCIIDDEN